MKSGNFNPRSELHRLNLSRLCQIVQKCYFIISWNVLAKFSLTMLVSNYNINMYIIYIHFHSVFQLVGKLVKATLCPSRRFPGAKPRAFYISSAVKDLFGYYLKGKAIDINNIKYNVYLQLLNLDMSRKNAWNS